MKYQDSGVNIEKAGRIKKSLSQLVKASWDEHVLSEIGHFGGLFSLPGGFKEPVLVSSVDGVGTKVLVAKMAGVYDTVGQDLVNHCANDILVQGARPLFFLDYIAAGELDEGVVISVVAGLSKACANNGCALIGGETAEMPGLYQGSEFDLAGCIVGVVEKSSIIDGRRITPGDAVFALPSSGLHTNGYSLARRIFFDRLGLGIGDRVDELGCTVGEELLKVHTSYVRPVNGLIQRADVKGLAHITGGGLIENLPRILPRSCNAVIDRGSWPVPPVFTFLRERGEIDEREMYTVFNMGLGMIVITSPEDAGSVLKFNDGPDIYRVGRITAGEGKVVLA
jgi:phosphoribosylformylglycinamidine cyclo-ligase